MKDVINNSNIDAVIKAMMKHFIPKFISDIPKLVRYPGFDFVITFFTFPYSIYGNVMKDKFKSLAVPLLQKYYKGKISINNFATKQGYIYTLNYPETSKNPLFNLKTMQNRSELSSVKSTTPTSVKPSSSVKSTSSTKEILASDLSPFNDIKYAIEPSVLKHAKKDYNSIVKEVFNVLNKLKKIDEKELNNPNGDYAIGIQKQVVPLLLKFAKKYDQKTGAKLLKFFLVKHVTDLLDNFYTGPPINIQIPVPPDSIFKTDPRAAQFEIKI
jgi:hypothetical protein